MDPEMADVLERLVTDFASSPLTTVIRVVTDCVAESPNCVPADVERMARERLAAVA